jgi:hypothetical protein
VIDADVVTIRRVKLVHYVPGLRQRFQQRCLFGLDRFEQENTKGV